MSSSMIKDLGEHPEDKKPVRVMKGQYGPYIKYKSLNATIPEEKDPTELTMEEALILIEKRKEYDKTKKSKKKNEKKFIIKMSYDDKIKELNEDKTSRSKTTSWKLCCNKNFRKNVIYIWTNFY